MWMELQLMENEIRKIKGEFSDMNLQAEKSKRASYKRVFKPQPTQLSQISLTQSLFPEKKNSVRNINSLNSQVASQFSQTLAYGFGGQFNRPQSKRASRKQSSRPETSKGARTVTRQRVNYEDWKNAGSSKSMYQQFQQIQSGQEVSSSQVNIVLNQRQKPQKQKSFYGEKFKTELPDDFLCLFAD